MCRQDGKTIKDIINLIAQGLVFGVRPFENAPSGIPENLKEGKGQ